MAAAVVIGGVALLADLHSSRPADKPSPPPSPPPPKRPSAVAATSSSRRFPSLSAPVSPRSSTRRPCVASAAGPSPEGSGNDGDVEDEDATEGYEWEERLKERIKEFEEMRELERKAEELQANAEAGEEETEEEKRERVRRELEKVAKEQAERRATAKLMFEVGQKAYEKGMYSRAIEFLEAALTIIARSTLLGGEIQIWLAMAYEANKRHRDCIALYQQLEMQHPSLKIRRQAAELRYILQAPKLKITKEEMVTIPLIGTSYDWYAGTWSDKYKDRDSSRKYTTTNQLPTSKDYLADFMIWRPPSGWEKNPNLWAIMALWACLVGTALYLQR